MRAREAIGAPPYLSGTPFGPAWDELTLDAMQAFFAEAGDEGMNWEAKGGTIRADQVREAASAFGNSFMGGFLVLGASRRSRRDSWGVDGGAFTTEPITWVSDCLANGAVAPVPAFDTKAWSLDPTRSLAVVRFWPAAVPPVLTRDGRMYDRVPGASPLVTSPQTVRDLVARGDRATERARQLAEAARQEMWNNSGFEGCDMVIAMASPSLPEDASSLVFRASTRESMLGALRGPLSTATNGLDRHALRGEVSQGTIALTQPGWDESEGWSIRVGRHGAVAVGRGRRGDHGTQAVAATQATVLTAPWQVTCGILRQMGGLGPYHLALRVNDRRFGMVDYARWVSPDGPWPHELESLAREAARVDGSGVWEPEGQEMSRYRA